MRKLFTVILLLAAGTSTLSAQNPQVRQQRLRQQVVERFMQNLRTQAGLTEDQHERLQEVTRQSFLDRAELLAQERAIWGALEGQMRPGVAADGDSLARLIDAVIDAQGARIEQARAEQRELAEFLTPVQRAQFTLAWRRLQMQIERARGMGQQQRRPM
jgi:hypothetical protein